MGFDCCHEIYWNETFILSKFGNLTCTNGLHAQNHQHQKHGGVQHFTRCNLEPRMFSGETKSSWSHWHYIWHVSPWILLVNIWWTFRWWSESIMDVLHVWSPVMPIIFGARSSWLLSVHWIGNYRLLICRSCPLTTSESEMKFGHRSRSRAHCEFDKVNWWLVGLLPAWKPWFLIEHHRLCSDFRTLDSVPLWTP